MINVSTLNCLERQRFSSLSLSSKRRESHRVGNFTGVLPFIDLAGTLLQFFNLASGPLFTFGSLREFTYWKRERLFVFHKYHDVTQFFNEKQNL